MPEDKPDRVMYNWEKDKITRVEIYDGTNNKPKIPTGGWAERVHKERLKNKERKTKHHGRIR